MYSSFHIKNFRGFTDFEIDGLQRINLIAGRNNTGKTSLLEAIFIHTNQYVYAILNSQSARGVEIATYDNTMAPWQSIFHKLDVTKNVEIQSKSNGKIASISISDESNSEKFSMAKKKYYTQKSTDAYNTHDPKDIRLLNLWKSESQNLRSGSQTLFQDRTGYTVDPITASSINSVKFIDAHHRPTSSDIASYFSHLVRSKNEKFLINAIQIIDSRLQSLDVLFSNTVPIMYADITLDQLIPLNALGDGIVRLTNILLQIGVNENGIILIDEIENGFHYSILPQVWKAIAQAARDFDVQIFATTHSLEMIRAAHEAFKDQDPYDFAYHRLDRDNAGKIIAKTYDEETLEASIDMNFEVR